MSALVMPDVALEHWADAFVAAGGDAAMTFEQFLQLAPAMRTRKLAAFAHVQSLQTRVEPSADATVMHGEHVVEPMRHHALGHTPAGFRRLRMEGNAP